MGFKSSSVATAEDGEVIVSAPSGMAEGDRLMAWFAVNNDGDRGDFPAGWTFGSTGGVHGGGSWISQWGTAWSESGLWLWNLNKVAEESDVGASISMGTGGSGRKTLAVLCYSEDLVAPPDEPPAGIPGTASYRRDAYIPPDHPYYQQIPATSDGAIAPVGVEDTRNPAPSWGGPGTQDPDAYPIVAVTAWRELGYWNPPIEEDLSFTQSGGVTRATIGGLLPLIVWEGYGTTYWTWDDEVSLIEGRMLVMSGVVSGGGWGVGQVRMGSN